MQYRTKRRADQPVVVHRFRRAVHPFIHSSFHSFSHSLLQVCALSCLLPACMCMCQPLVRRHADLCYLRVQHGRLLFFSGVAGGHFAFGPDAAVGPAVKDTYYVARRSVPYMLLWKQQLPFVNFAIRGDRSLILEKMSCLSGKFS